MPWSHVDDLPASVREHLPLHAQEIFLAAFNRASAARPGDPDAETTAFRIAWGAVKRSYRKAGAIWVPRQG